LKKIFQNFQNKLKDRAYIRLTYKYNHMRHLLTPIKFTLAGYLVCVLSFFAVIDSHTTQQDEFIMLFWSLGIGSAIFFTREKNIWKKFAYLVLPVPLGFFLTLAAIFYGFSVWGMFQ